MHDAVIHYVSEHVHLLGLDGGDVLDLGGRDVNGTTRSLFPNATSYITVDIAPHESVDVVADAATINLGRTFDVVVSTECLEHTDQGPAIITNAYRHLRTDGVFIATMAGPGRAPHGAGGEPSPPPGEWYRNVEPDELGQWLTDAGFAEYVVDVSGLDVRCWALRRD